MTKKRAVKDLLTDEELKERVLADPRVKKDLAEAIRRAVKLREQAGNTDSDLLNHPGDQGRLNLGS